MNPQIQALGREQCHRRQTSLEISRWNFNNCCWPCSYILFGRGRDKTIEKRRRPILIWLEITVGAKGATEVQIIITDNEMQRVTAMLCSTAECHMCGTYITVTVNGK